MCGEFIIEECIKAHFWEVGYWQELVEPLMQAPGLETALLGIWQGSVSHLCMHTHSHRKTCTYMYPHLLWATVSSSMAKKGVLGILGVLVHVEERFC